MGRCSGGQGYGYFDEVRDGSSGAVPRTAAPGAAFPWTTFAVDVSGSFLPALLLVYVFEIWPPTRYVRPFAAVGFLGAFTTFSTWTVDTDRLLGHDHCTAAAPNIFGSLFAGLAAIVLGLAIGRESAARRIRLDARRGRWGCWWASAHGTRCRNRS
ncbi:CrcB family protein [Streptomyces sp. GbtcB6]|uniref:fluoride efflux transporter FluC n=1 Tax=Streptomyces sp. GbtcB6 TaxID=2824751 RepID=UPI001C3100F6|nr:CrcB family protein [Streptomyces sp. GbtcB6]